MSNDLMSQFYTSLNLPLQERLIEITRIIDHSGPSKDLQGLFLQLVSSLFNSSIGNNWGLRTITYDSNRYDFEALISFLEPQGPMFRLCYKLLSDPQLKYNMPINVLPLELQMTLERGRCPQFYADMLVMDPQSLNVAGLSLNPFDYYILNFALHLVNNNQNKSSWENWNSVYFALACDYLMHFLPSDPNVPVLPHIPNYTGKVPMVAPLQTANRPLCSPSLLLLPDLSGISQPTSSQTQSRNEVWRSETVLQIFIDIWMSVEPFNPRNVEMYQKNIVMASSPERVRTCRVLVKHIHSFSAKHLTDLTNRSSALRKYARQIMCARAYQYIKHLVMTWPLDASFRLVMELWLSLIQPWRYADNNINSDRFPGTNNNRDDANVSTLDASFIQFIAENFPSYTCIFQMVMPRFMRLDLTANKNAVMLFRLGKVFSQPHLVPILCNLEQAITENATGLHNTDRSYQNDSAMDSSFTYNGIPLHKWVAVANQAISELNLNSNFVYEPVWTENGKQFALEFTKKVLTAKVAADKNFEEFNKGLNQLQLGFWSSIKIFFMIGDKDEERLLLEEYKKVPVYLNSSVHYFSRIFNLNENTLLPLDPIDENSFMEHSSFGNTSNFQQYITNKLRNKRTDISYMGDPDLMPIATYESTILVRMLYQISCKLNEVYGEEFSRLWTKDGFWGHVTREVLQKPCQIQTFIKGVSHQNIVNTELPARLSLRKLGSYAVVIWVTIGYLLFRLFSYSGFFYAFVLIFTWLFVVVTKASLKTLRIISS